MKKAHLMRGRRPLARALWIFGVMFLAGGLASAVQAQPPRSQGDVVEHDFTDADQVEGDRHTAWGDRLGGRVRGERRSLIRPRWSFSRELRQSVENL